MNFEGSLVRWAGAHCFTTRLEENWWLGKLGKDIMAKTTDKRIRYGEAVKNRARQMVEDNVPGLEITQKLKLGKYTLNEWRKVWRKQR